MPITNPITFAEARAAGRRQPARPAPHDPAVALVHWGIAATQLPVFQATPDGLALLALLANAGAKENPQRYALKADLVTAACRAAGRNRSWQDTRVQ
jgi:hypothetical protein